VSEAGPTELRTLAFGDAGAGVWGAAWVPAGGRGFVCVGAIAQPPEIVIAPLLEAPSQAGGEWRLTAPDLELTVTAEGEAAPVTIEGVGVDGFAQLCRVRGRLREREIDSPGLRELHTGAGLAGSESVRDVAAWFGDDEGVAVLAARPRSSAGHDKDAVGGVLLESGLHVPVADPRLSTTYAAGGVPSRAGLELWVTGEEDEDGAEVQYPRRAAGEAVGSGIELQDTQFDVRAELFRWHMRGREGLGVYQLLRAR
jgi:hypothetical protein